jgi:hypothetical protein
MLNSSPGRDELCGSPLPANLAFLEAGRTSWIWRIPCCGLCNLTHVHGGGPLTRHPVLNHKAAYCSRSGYVLLDGDTERTKRLVDEIHARGGRLQ